MFTMPSMRRTIAVTAFVAATVFSCAQSFQIAEVFKSLKGIPVGQNVVFVVLT
jgi:hypothetical protein